MSLPWKKDEEITSDILKTCFCVIREELTMLINDSLNKDTCPEGWKTSTIISIPKIEKLKKASEYRPINIWKVLELVVKEQIKKYLQDNNIITEHQLGFKKNHSCETAIQTVFDD